MAEIYSSLLHGVITVSQSPCMTHLFPILQVAKGFEWLCRLLFTENQIYALGFHTVSTSIDQFRASYGKSSNFPVIHVCLLHWIPSHYTMLDLFIELSKLSKAKYTLNKIILHFYSSNWLEIPLKSCITCLFSLNFLRLWQYWWYQYTLPIQIQCSSWCAESGKFTF